MTKRETPAQKAERLAARRTVGAADTDARTETSEVRPAVAHAAVSTAPRVKDVRVSLDLKPGLYEQLGDWNRQAARQLDRGRVTNAETLRALVRRLMHDAELAAAVVRDLDSNR